MKQQAGVAAAALILFWSCNRVEDASPPAVPPIRVGSRFIDLGTIEQGSPIVADVHFSATRDCLLKVRAAKCGCQNVSLVDVDALRTSVFSAAGVRLRRDDALLLRCEFNVPPDFRGQKTERVVLIVGDWRLELLVRFYLKVRHPLRILSAARGMDFGKVPCAGSVHSFEIGVLPTRLIRPIVVTPTGNGVGFRIVGKLVPFGEGLSGFVLDGGGAPGSTSYGSIRMEMLGLGRTVIPMKAMY